ncbi:MAG: hypothetical protein U9N83_11310 [Thermodesulfobacteriota bacterium]|nr:hypothetical protein [Thermodesulfobacteriota bacterium]
MKKFIVFFLLIFIGCSPVYFQPKNPGVDYRWAIENWQKRIQKESWNEALIDNIMSSCLMISKYEMESGDDYWKTYQEFLKDFSGDCEDIAIFMYGTLRRLGYPKGIRLRVIRMPLGDHTVLMVELPNGRWKMFNSTPMPGDFFDIAVSRTLVEWDDRNIYYP